jgi:aspartate/methionine/tyrosine aminotransferase
MFIPRLNQIEEIEALEEEFHKEKGIYPTNVSSWHVSPSFTALMQRTIHLPKNTEWIKYKYTYNLPQGVNISVKQKLGLNKISDDVAIVYFPNNTISIVNIVNYLCRSGISSVGVVNPAYFSVVHATSLSGQRCQEFSMKNIQGDWHIPVNELLKSKVQAIWITSPIYSTGIYYSEENIHEIELLLQESIMIVIDESFCLPGHELFPRLFGKGDIISILSPHKAICINGLKFSAVLCSRELQDAFEQWCDVFSGNLPPSSVSAIFHFDSDNYNICYHAFNDYISPVKAFVHSLPAQFQRVSCDTRFKGSLATLFINGISNEVFNSLAFTKILMCKTYALFYPGFLNGFNESHEPCFRINLTLDSPDFRASLTRILKFLDTY